MTHIDIKVNGKSLVLDPKCKLQAEIASPAFDRTATIAPGTFSYPMDMPVCPVNQNILGFVEQIPNTKNPQARIPCDVYIDGMFAFDGLLQYQQVSDTRYQTNIIAGTAWFSLIAANMKMTEIKGNDLMPDVATLTANVPTPTINAVLTDAINNPKRYNFGVYTVKNPSAYEGLANAAGFLNYINYYYNGILFDSYNSENNEVPSSSVVTSTGHSNSIYPYVSYVLQTFLKQIGFSLSGTFVTDAELKTLTMLNNFLLDYCVNEPFKASTGLSSVDTYTNDTGGPNAKVITSDTDYNLLGFVLYNLMPDGVLVTDWLASLKGMFNLGFFFDFRKRNANIVALKDLLTGTEIIDWTAIANAKPNQFNVAPVYYTFKYTSDGNDALAKTHDQAPTQYMIVRGSVIWGDMPYTNSIDLTYGNRYPYLSYVGLWNQFWISQGYPYAEPVIFSTNFYGRTDPRLFVLNSVNNIIPGSDVDINLTPTEITVAAEPGFMAYDIDELTVWNTYMSHTNTYDYPDVVTRTWYIPVMNVKGNSADVYFRNNNSLAYNPALSNLPRNTFGLRYLFNRGLVGTDRFAYPLGSYDVYSWNSMYAYSHFWAAHSSGDEPQKIANANYALYWTKPQIGNPALNTPGDPVQYPNEDLAGGVFEELVDPDTGTADPDHGLYITWWKPWLDFMEKTKIVSYFMRFRAQDIQDIDFTKKYLIDRQLYLIGKVYLTVSQENGIEPSRVDFYKL